MDVLKPNDYLIDFISLKKTLWLIVQATLDLRNFIFPFLNRELFDLRKIYAVNLKTGRPKKMPYVGEFAT